MILPTRLNNPPKLLMVEPSALLRAVVRSACERRGIPIDFADDASDAMGYIARSVPTAVLTAVALPGLPGTSLVAALKSSPQHRFIPVALLTSDVQDGYESGMYEPDAVILKGRDFEGAVQRFLSTLVTKGTDGVDKPSGGDAAPLQDARILVADDSSMMQKIVGRFLHGAGTAVTMVDNGEQAVSVVDRGGFDLVLMDIEMPVMGGREATQIMRAKGVALPVVALTAHDADVFRSIALAEGFDEVAPKPVRRDQLIATCTRLVATSHATR